MKVSEVAIPQNADAANWTNGILRLAFVYFKALEVFSLILNILIVKNIKHVTDSNLLNSCTDEHNILET